MKNIFKLTLVLTLLSLFGQVQAREFVGKVSKTSPAKEAGVERCRRAQGSAELSINNVRARINTGGNMWYDGNTARYYVPKDGNSTPMFCAALWIGGQDENKQLRVAALRFGQDGDDFWPGPLTVDANASVNKSVCEKWDKHFRITRAEVESFIGACQKDAQGKIIGGPTEQSYYTEAIMNWPAHPENYAELKQSKYLAPFMDVDGDGEYDPNKGDHPYYDLNGDLCPTEARQGGQPYNPIRTMEDSIGTGGLPVHGGILVDQVLKGDETLWWVFNDKGNAHTESKSQNPIGLEIRAQAFAFNSNDEINNMTFYSYEIINRSTFTLQNTYFSQWVDPDLGYAFDDYVGCDVKRGLGYCYNGTATDGPGVGSYSGNPPAIGIDFFQGPYLDPDGMDNPKVYIHLALKDSEGQRLLENYVKKNDDGSDMTDPVSGQKVYDTLLITRDAELFVDYWYDPDDKITNGANINGVNFGNGIVDDERFGMRRFVYYENSWDAVRGEPDKATDYYNYLRGIWKTGERMTFGGTGSSGSAGNTGIECDFMFPGTTDPWNWGTKGVDPQFGDTRGWTEESSDNAPGDRRFMQSAGPFELRPGAINYITVGIPFAQATSGGPFASVTLLRQVDDKCQALFDNCFNILEGPDAPDLVIKELDRELIIFLTNDSPISNNVNEGFNVMDVRIPRSYNVTVQVVDTVTHTVSDSVVNTVEYDQYYKFEGYQIFQLRDQSVSVADIYDEDKARLVAQCDVENYYPENNQPIGKLVNFAMDNNIGTLVPQVMVEGLNRGIQHSFRITEDKFATTNDKRIVNNKKYYYVAIAYAHNNFKSYNPEDATKIDGQKEPYLPSRKDGYGMSIRPVVAIPHKLEPEQGGTIVQSAYGMCPEITRIEGHGNGGMVLNFKTETIEKIVGKPGEEISGQAYLPELVYEKNYGPLNIKIVDPVKLTPGSFIIKVLPSDTTDNLGYSKWQLTNSDPSKPLFKINGNGDGVYMIESDRMIEEINEQIIFPLGISITLTNPKQTARTLSYAMNKVVNQERVIGGDFRKGTALNSRIKPEDPGKTWLYGIADNDASSVLNWIRSGSSFSSEDIRRNFLTADVSNTIDYLLQDYYFATTDSIRKQDGTFDYIDMNFSIDEDAEYESFADGWWAPYRLTSVYTNYEGVVYPHPGFSYYHFSPEGSDETTKWRLDPGFIYSTTSNNPNNLASVDIVFTSDKSKWTRCPVIEMGDDTMQTVGGAKRFQLRKSPSVDKDGKSLNDGTMGMGWFPGYAINLETGQRLNMFFGENSQLGIGQPGNGRDMIWNPTSTMSDGGGIVFGGMHYVYVLGATTDTLHHRHQITGFPTETVVNSPSYYEDRGQWAYDKLQKLDLIQGVYNGANNPSGLTRQNPYNNDFRNKSLLEAMEVFSSVMWVGMPIATAFDKDPKAEIPTDVTVSLRVAQPYSINYTGAGDLASSPQNKNYPMYEFTITQDIATVVGDYDFGNEAMDLITVVPNPYFAASTYEQDQVHNLVKITNLPPDSYITIYAVDGTVVRKLRGPSKNLVSGQGTALTSIDWDLKNHKGLPISGGVYMIHIQAEGIGERIIKWFGALRPVDLNSFQ